MKMKSISKFLLMLCLSNKKIATVTQAGNVVAKDKGTCIITVTQSANKKCVFNIAVQVYMPK